MEITNKTQKTIQEWIKIKKLKKLNSQVRIKPLDFKYTAKTIRDINRQ